jgi:hypothetical protein
MGWSLLKRRLGTWVLAVFVVGLAAMGGQLVLNLLLGLAAGIGAATIQGPAPMVISTVAMMAAGIMLQGVLYGSLSKMALKQIDGEEIAVGDVFTVGNAAPGLALAWLLVGIGMNLGLLLLIIPGLVFAGLTMFTLPAVVEGVGSVEAIRRSIRTLKQQWLMATVFAIVSWLILAAGALLCGVGMLLTFPLYVLAGTVQYRRSFAPGGVPRKAVVADPLAEAVGERPAPASGRMPGWAWGLIGLAVLAVPLGCGGVFVALLMPAVQQARQRAREQVVRQQMQEQVPGAPVPAEGPGEFLPPGPGAPVPPVDPGEFVPPGARPGRGPELEPPPAAEGDQVEQPRLGSPESGTDLKPALDALKGSETRECQRALEDLARRAADDAFRETVLAAVLPLVNDPEPSIRRGALKVVQTWGTAEHGPLFLDALDDSDRGVQSVAVTALRKQADGPSALALARRLTDPRLRVMAANALLAMKPQKDPALEAEVLKALESSHPATRQAACLVLRVIGTEASVPALKEAAVDEQRGVSSAARSTLKAIDPAALSELPPVKSRSRSLPRSKKARPPVRPNR